MLDSPRAAVRLAASALTAASLVARPGALRDFSSHSRTRRTALRLSRAQVRERSRVHMGKGASKPKEAASAELPADLSKKLGEMFERMDTNKDGTVDKSEAIAFWGKNFAKINAGAMFNEVDMDKNGEMTKDEWLAFWQNVLSHGYSVRDRHAKHRTRSRAVPFLISPTTCGDDARCVSPLSARPSVRRRRR